MISKPICSKTFHPNFNRIIKVLASSSKKKFRKIIKENVAIVLKKKYVQNPKIS